jgi:hypothetical protein
MRERCAADTTIPPAAPEKAAALATDAAARIALGETAYQAAARRGATRSLGTSAEP